MESKSSADIGVALQIVNLQWRRSRRIVGRVGMVVKQPSGRSVRQAPCKAADVLDMESAAASIGVTARPRRP